MLLLKLLERREDYGYSLVIRLQQLGFDDLVEGTVYPALTRLEKRDLLASRLVKSTSGPARKYYRLTPAGADELARTATSWTELVSTVERAMAAEAQTDPPNPPFQEDPK